MIELYVLETLMAGLQGRVALNGVEIVADESAASKTLAQRVNPWIVEGENRLAVALRLPPPSPPAPAPDTPVWQAPPTAAAPDGPDFSLRLIGGRFGVEPGPEGDLLRYAWEAAREPLAPRQWRIMLNQGFRPPRSFGRWLWQDAPAGPPQAGDAADLRAAVGQLMAAAQARDVRALLLAHRLKFAEMARAMDDSESLFSDDLAQALEALFAARDYAVRPLDATLLVLEPLAEGRLVRVRRPDGTAPLQLSGGGEVLHILPLYTRTATGWVIAR